MSDAPEFDDLVGTLDESRPRPVRARGACGGCTTCSSRPGHRPSSGGGPRSRPATRDAVPISAHDEPRRLALIAAADRSPSRASAAAPALGGPTPPLDSRHVPMRGPTAAAGAPASVQPLNKDPAATGRWS